MLIQNTTSKSLTVLEYTIESGGTIEIPDYYAYHPSVSPLITAGTLRILSGTSTNVSDALANASNPSRSNPVVTRSELNTSISRHVASESAHHTNSNDPTTNEKEAMSHAVNPTGANPFTTQSYVVDKAAADFAQHLIDYSHTAELTADELAAIQDSTLPGALNVFTTATHATALVASGIAVHTAIATAHHTNVNDPTANQKAALNAATTLDGTDHVAAISDITAHTAVASAHHSNANDPTSDEKAALVGTSGSPSVSNKYITDADTRIPTAGQKLALAGTTGTPGTANRYVTETDTTYLLTANQKASLAANAGLSGANMALSQLELTNHTAIATAHHSNTNDPSAGEKLALAGTTGTPSVANRYVTETDTTLLLSAQQKAALTANAGLSGANMVLSQLELTTHAALPDVHHSNDNDPSSGEKNALAGTNGTPGVANPYVTDSDPRNTNSRTPVAHATSHTDGTDDIQSATNAVKGLATTAHIITQERHTEDIITYCRLTRKDATTLAVKGIGSKKVMIGNTEITLTVDIEVDTSDKLIDATGAVTLNDPVLNTTYYVYLSSTEARLCSTAPTYYGEKQYLTAAKTWLFIGWCRTDASVEFTNDFSVYSFYNRLPTVLMAATVETASSADDTYDAIYTFSSLMPEDALLQFQVVASVETNAPSVAGTVATAAVNGTAKMTVDTIIDTQVMVGLSYAELSSALAYTTYSVQVKYAESDNSTTRAGSISIIRQ